MSSRLRHSGSLALLLLAAGACRASSSDPSTSNADPDVDAACPECGSSEGAAPAPSAGPDAAPAPSLPPGSLDPTFGKAGAVTLTGVLQSLAVAGDDSVVLGVNASSDVYLERLDATGTPDAAFGSAGGKLAIDKQKADLGSASSRFDAKGNLLVGLWAQSSNAAGTFPGSVHLGMLRASASGKLDGPFGAGGYASSNPSVGYEFAAHDMVELPDSSIVAVGEARRTLGYGDMAAAKWSAAGVLDTSFGTGGAFVKTFGEYTASAVLAAHAKGDGSAHVLAMGFHELAGSADGSAVVLFQMSGTGALDGNFGGFDMATVGYGYPQAMASVPGGFVVVGSLKASQGGPDPAYAVVLRVKDAGVADASFGKSGFVTLSASASASGAASAAAVDSKGRILVARSFGTPTAGQLTRLLPNGDLDTSFGKGGSVEIPVSNPARVAVDSKDRVVVAGISPSSMSALSVARVTP